MKALDQIPAKQLQKGCKVLNDSGLLTEEQKVKMFGVTKQVMLEDFTAKFEMVQEDPGKGDTALLEKAKDAVAVFNFIYADESGPTADPKEKAPEPATETKPAEPAEPTKEKKSRKKKFDAKTEEQTTTEKAPGKRPVSPGWSPEQLQSSNKYKVWKAWVDSEKKAPAEDLHKVVNEAVKLQTIKNWIKSWLKGSNLPGGHKLHQ